MADPTHPLACERCGKIQNTDCGVEGCPHEHRFDAFGLFSSPRERPKDRRKDFPKSEPK